VQRDTCIISAKSAKPTSEALVVSAAFYVQFVEKAATNRVRPLCMFSVEKFLRVGTL